MTLIDLIRRRRSVKHFDPDHRLSDDELRRLLTASALAPTSFNMQNRHLVCVVDPAVKAELFTAAWGQEQIRDASVVVVLTGDRRAYRNTARYLRHAPRDARETYERMIPAMYAEDDALARDEDVRSVGLAAMNLMLMATEMELESCPMIGFDPDRVREILGLPVDHAPLMIVVIGRGVRPPRERMGLLDLEEFVSVDRFGTHSIEGPVDA